MVRVLPEPLMWDGESCHGDLRLWSQHKSKYETETQNNSKLQYILILSNYDDVILWQLYPNRVQSNSTGTVLVVQMECKRYLWDVCVRWTVPRRHPLAPTLLFVCGPSVSKLHCLTDTPCSMQGLHKENKRLKVAFVLSLLTTSFLHHQRDLKIKQIAHLKSQP